MKVIAKFEYEKTTKAQQKVVLRVYPATNAAAMIAAGEWLRENPAFEVERFEIAENVSTYIVMYGIWQAKCDTCNKLAFIQEEKQCWCGSGTLKKLQN